MNRNFIVLFFVKIIHLFYYIVTAIFRLLYAKFETCKSKSPGNSNKLHCKLVPTKQQKKLNTFYWLSQYLRNQQMQHILIVERHENITVVKSPSI